MPGRRPRGNSCEGGAVTQVGLPREVGGGKDFTGDWLAPAAGSHPSFVRSPFRESWPHLQSPGAPGGLCCACTHPRAGTAPSLRWWTVYRQTQTNGKTPDIPKQTKCLQSAPHGARETDLGPKRDLPASWSRSLGLEIVLSALLPYAGPTGGAQAQSCIVSKTMMGTGRRRRSGGRGCVSETPWLRILVQDRNVARKGKMSRDCGAAGRRFVLGPGLVRPSLLLAPNQAMSQ